jgi:hypothetical protein
MQDSGLNPYQSTIDAKTPAKQPARWWKRILIAAIGFGLFNVFLILGKVILDRRNG